MDVLPTLRMQVDRCEALGVAVLCCPEGMVGRLAEYVAMPAQVAIRVAAGELATLLAPLASDTVTIIVGFTEVDGNGRLYNATAAWSRGAVIGVYRKRHPAIRRFVYHAGHEIPVFSAGSFTFGVMICRDSVYPEVAHALVACGAHALFVATNNGMPEARGGAALIAHTRAVDIACAAEHDISVIRADVVGRAASLISYGATGIVDRHGHVVGEARMLEDGRGGGCRRHTA